VIAAEDLRGAKALVWLRWRLFLNSLTRSGGRDWMERVSRAVAASLPLALAALMLPAALALAGAALYAGLAVGADPGANPGALTALRVALGVATLFAVASPLMFGTAHGAAGLVGLLRLPLSSRLLYAAHALGGLLDLWVLAVLPALGVFALAVSVAVPGRSVLVLPAALLAVGALSGLTAVVSAASLVIARDRRRAERILVVSLLLFGVVFLLPALLHDPDTRRTDGRERPAAQHEQETPSGAAAVAIERVVMAVVRASPGELLVAAGRGGEAGPLLAPLAGLALWALGTHAAAWRLFRRLLQAPPVWRRRMHGGGLGRFSPVVPLLGPQGSAVAVAAARLVWRSPQGRLNLLMAIVFTTAIAVGVTFGGQGVPIGPIRLGGGLPVALFCLYFTTASLGVFLFNQFAAQGRGLLLLLLSPIRLRVLLIGHAAGALLAGSLPLVIAFAAGLATGDLPPTLAASLLLGIGAVWLVLVPAAAMLSAAFPQAVDLSRVGRRSAPHQAANLLGQLIVAATGALAAATAWLGHRLAGAAGLVAASALVLVAATAATLVLFAAAERLVDRRRENLALVAEGR
jgi:hypothetical protein